MHTNTLDYSFPPSTGVIASELVMKAKRKVTSLWKSGHISNAVFVKILDCQFMTYVQYGAEIWGL